MEHANDNDTLAADILRGADDIAAFTGLERSAVYYAIRKGCLPIFRIGGGVFARKSTLLAWVSAQESRTA